MDLRKVLGILVVAASFTISGCAAVLVGAGVAGGYAIGKDSVKNHFDMPRDRVFRESLSVAKEMGRITLEDAKNGKIQADVKDVDITITVRQLTKKTVELKVKGRNKYKMPAVDVAQEVYNKIAENLKKGWGLF